MGGAALLPLWPKVEFRGLVRVQPPKPPSSSRLTLEHDWERQGSFWRCRVCLRGSRASSWPRGGS
eukprot:1129316-Pyramimonas_sp.AAC.1